MDTIITTIIIITIIGSTVIVNAGQGWSVSVMYVYTPRLGSYL